MHRGIYIGGHDIQEFGAKLQTDYAIGGGEIENITNRGEGRSSTLLLRQNREPLTIRWSFQRRDDRAAVLGIEFPPDLAEACLLEQDGRDAPLEVDYAVNLWWRCP